MDIPLVSPPPPGAAASIAPLVSATALAIEQAQSAPLLNASLTTVDLSPLGRFLSATALFQKRTLELQIAAGSPATEQDTVSEPEAIVLAAQALSVAFNELTGSDADNSGLPSGPFDGQPLATLFAQQFGGDDADLASLAAAGLTFVPGAAPDAPEELSVDLPVLQAAFERDPVATAALLSNAATAFSALAGVAPEAAAIAETPLPANAPLVAPEAQAAPELPTPEDAFLRALLSENATVIAAPDEDIDAVVPAPANPLAAPIASDEPVALGAAAPASVPAAVAAPDDAVELPAPVDAAPIPAPAAAAPVDSLAIEQEVDAVVNSVLAEQAALAARTAAIASEARTERLAVEGRAALSAFDQARELTQANQARADARALEHRRQQQASRLADITLAPVTLTTTIPVRPVPQGEEAVVVARPLPTPAPLDRAPPAARDPATAAALAAYSLNVAPFAALNARVEMAAPRVRIIPAVSSVAKVAAIDTDSTARGGTKESR